MRVLEQVVFAVLRDNRWRTCTDVAFAAGLPEIRTQEALEALLEKGRIRRERVQHTWIYQAGYPEAEE